MPLDPAPGRRQFLASAALLSGAVAFGQDTAPPLAPPKKEPEKLNLPGPPEKPFGFAVVGLGQLALDQVLPAFGLCRRAKCVALVSGHPEKAKRVAEAYHVDPKNIYDYQTYDKLIDNPAVDVIYIILPNSMHAEYTIRGFKAGKHVLCEKPMATSAAECRAMIAAGDKAGKQLMIAYRLHYEPFNRTAMDLCGKGEIGQIRTVVASNCQTTNAPNIRLSKELGGGPLQDVGVYCLNAARYITHENPASVTAFAERPKSDPRFREVPASVAFTLRFPSGALANCDCSFASDESRYLRAIGSAGWLELDAAFSYSGQRLTVNHGDRRSQLRITAANHFAAEMDHFAGCVAQNKPNRTPGQEGLTDQLVMDAINRAAETGRRVEVSYS